MPTSVLLSTWLLPCVPPTSSACAGARLASGSAIPIGSGEHTAAPASEKVPAPHAAQPAALSVPGLVTVPAKPGAQIVQAATEVLLVCEAVVVMPRGQLAQLVALAEAEYAPAVHGKQRLAPAPEKQPAAQGEQLAAPAPEKEPGRHAAQPAAAAVPGLVTAPK